MTILLGEKGKRVSWSNHPAAAAISPHQPLLGPLQVSLCPIAFKATAPFKTIHDTADKLGPPLNVNA